MCAFLILSVIGVPSSQRTDSIMFTTQVTYEYFGEMKTHDLVEGGGDIPVTNDNRERY
jgi:hypothetical protein